ncbi:MAG TPA: AGE family epimerase/isomerase [Marinobacterium sp.]|nr:AGE family epimerase/isomerase [Marinobacterium sp.]
MKFDSREFLQQHTESILAFYEPVARDPKGGFFQNFRDDGRVFDPVNRHLVSSTRFVFNYSEAYRRGYADHYSDWAREGLRYLESHHRVDGLGHYGWMHGERLDNTAMAYGQAFVILAYSHAHLAGLTDASLAIAAVHQLLEDYFYEPTQRAYADQRSPDLQQLDPYRGQNANMHLCEAYIAAFRATQDPRYFERANSLARRFAGELAEIAGGLIWEHYDVHWQPDWQYNIDKPDDLFKPWGFQPGHQNEWAKLLLQLHAINPDGWYVERARTLFNGAVEQGWDPEFGGLVYGFAPTGEFADANKYFWVQAESIAAAYRLYKVTGESVYLEWYNRLWEFSWKYLVDHQYGAWFRVVGRDGSKLSDEKSPMGKVDYHTLGACWDVIDNLD